MENKKLRGNKGITLIALVVTIIVLLILAGVTISLVLGNNGIIAKAQQAESKTNEAAKNEQNALADLESFMYESLGEMPNATPGQISNTNTRYTDSNNRTVVIPGGFAVSEEGSEQITSDGLVIKDSEGNEFVWIPVDGTNVTYTKWGPSLAYTHHSLTTDDTLPSGVTSEEDQINKYGGFYIAKYETGIPDSLPVAQTTANDTARNVEGKPISKRNSIPWNYIDYTNSKKNAESMYNTSSVQSGLVTGRMWDAAMKWIENSGKDVQTDSTGWGNYNNAAVTNITEYSTDHRGATWITTASTTKGTSTAWLLKTGHSEYTRAKNIFDLAGNLFEWTNEIYSSNRVNRGRL